MPSNPPHARAHYQHVSATTPTSAPDVLRDFSTASVCERLRALHMSSEQASADMPARGEGCTIPQHR